MSENENFLIISKNRKAHFNYFIKDTIEAGIALLGSEVKSCRGREVNVAEGFISENNGELFLHQVNIAEYKFAHQFNHVPTRPRKLLLKKKEIVKLLNAIQKKGATAIPLSMYFNHKGKVKVSIGIAEGKKLTDKRETIKQRDWDRQKQRVLRGDD